MNIPTQQDLLKAGVHLGHLSRKWNPYMAPFIFMESHGVHIIDLNKTATQLQEATKALESIAKAGKKILFVGTKKQAKELVAKTAQSLSMPYMTDRWLGGTLTNFITIRKLIKKLTSMDRMMKSASYKNMAKKEQLTIARNKAKLERVLSGVLDLNRLPGALVVVDITQEAISVNEANKLGIPVIALVDTNSNPNLVDYPIPSNDDAASSIELLLHSLGDAIATGLTMRQEDKDLAEQETKQQGDQDEQELPAPRLRRAKKVMYTEADLQEAAAYDEAQKKAIKDKIGGGIGRSNRGKPTSTLPSKKAPSIDKDLSKPNTSKPAPVRTEASVSPAIKETKPLTVSPQATKEQPEDTRSSAGEEQAP